eukprot:4612190-Prymnesium_polylepis.1
MSSARASLASAEPGVLMSASVATGRETANPSGSPADCSCRVWRVDCSCRVWLVGGRRCGVAAAGEERCGVASLGEVSRGMASLGADRSWRRARRAVSA